MSTTPADASSTTAGRPADPPLFSRLIDDAAVFPPGSAPLERAVAEHLARRRYAGIVGPLVVPATSAGDVAALVRAADGVLEVVLVARPGSPDGPVRDGVTRLADEATVSVVGVEVGHSRAWRDLLSLEVPVTVEIPREGQDAALDDVRAANAAGSGSGSAVPVQAKFRTGATESWRWPDEGELARLIRGCVDRGLRFKLTGGLHHAVRGDHTHAGALAPQHGLLNVLLAVHAAVGARSEAEVAQLLTQRDAPALARAVGDLGGADVAAVRRHFTAYGCCTVSDPVDELVDLGLLEEE